MLEFTINNGKMTGNVEGTTEDLLAEYTLLTYSFWVRTLAPEGISMNDFLEIMSHALKKVPTTYKITNQKMEDNSYYITNKTGVKQ